MKRIDDVIEWVHHLFVDEIQSDTKRFGEWFVDYLGDECWVTGDGGGGSYAVIHRGDNWILNSFWELADGSSFLTNFRD